MKQLLVLCCVVLVAQGIISQPRPEWQNDVLKAGSACGKEIGPSKDDIAPLKSRLTPTTPKGKCYVACCYEKMGFLDSDGHLNPEGIHAQLNKRREYNEEWYAILVQKMNGCLEQVKHHEDKCETAAEFYHCSESWDNNQVRN